MWFCHKGVYKKNYPCGDFWIRQALIQGFINIYLRRAWVQCNCRFSLISTCVDEMPINLRHTIGNNLTLHAVKTMGFLTRNFIIFNTQGSSVWKGLCLFIIITTFLLYLLENRQKPANKGVQVIFARQNWSR